MHKSLIIIARNEEYRLNLLLPLMRPLFEEIIIVDQESSDDTVNIAKRYANIVVTDKATGYADSSLGLAHSLVTTNCIVRIDSDEIITNRLLFDIRQYMTPDVKGLVCSRAYIELFEPIKLEQLKKCMEYGDNIDGIHHQSEPNQYRVYRKNCVSINQSLHGGTSPNHGDKIVFLFYNGIIHPKNITEWSIDHARYRAVEMGKYNKDIHF